MKKWSNTNLPGALHFVTGQVQNRIPLFRQEKYSRAFLKIFSEVSRRWPAKIVAYVLMPDHLDLIVNPRDGDIKGFCGALKSIAARKFIEMDGSRQFRRDASDRDGSIHQVWQESFKAFPLWSGWMIWQKIHYVHANPVKAWLVKSARDYEWSSFRAFHFQSNEPVAADSDWWWPDDEEKLKESFKLLGWLAPNMKG